ncbi:hypothetical protein CYFUS_004296 [Cystobacter fuscus]|uniref:Uncharacterized protein n=1 Tax=Cystobacter fuscus TaxID=43 RepID=A0A250J620_9BACT|nr:hypothetical protein [Cystobacter fuscus]ATB38861.1 hypothetical protein CYFUS_004296 [Cystobacter fuscus]
MRFVLEESSWAWDGKNRETYIERIEQLLDRLDIAYEREEPYLASRELLQQQVFGAYTLNDLLWNQDSPLNLPFEVSQRVVGHLNMMQYWDEEMAWPAIDVNIAGSDVLSPSAALVHARVGRRQATACLPLPGTWSGPCEVIVAGAKERIHFVVDEPSHRAFFRDTLEVEHVDEAGLEALAPHAFPVLMFLKGVWSELGHFEGGYARIRQSLHHFLAVLDDHGAWVFTDETGRLSPEEPVPGDKERRPVTNQLIQQRFIHWAFDVAPEKPNVRADGVCRRARERELGGQTLYCEWHYKFEGHVNRAHIHPPVTASKGKVIVAIFRDHLPLPGDG